MARKRICILVGHADESYQKAFIEGFLAKAFSYDYDICCFAAYNKYQESTVREIGENNIFSLIDFPSFDGVVALLDTIQAPGIAAELEERIKEKFSGPVVCIDKKSKYFVNLMTEHYKGVKKTINHLIEDHGYTDIAYLTGKEQHVYSKERLRAYIDSMNEHNLPIKEHRVFYGDYWFGSGSQTVIKLIQAGEQMPRAIACANDYMAIGVAQALEQYGFRIPEDVAVISYDSIQAGQTSPKPITSVPLPAKERGDYAADVIKSLIDGTDIPEYDVEPKIFYGSSCGCHNESVVISNGLRTRWETDEFDESFYSRFNHMPEDILSKTNFQDLINTIFAYTYQIKGFDNFTLCLNSQWKDISKLHDKDVQWDRYTDDILPVLNCKKTKSKENPINYETTFKKKLMHPKLHEDHDKPNVFYFTPLFFEERCFGYAVINYENQVKVFEESYWGWLRNIMHGLECFRRIDALQQTNILLQSSQIRDSLTGLFNYQGLIQQLDGYYGQNIGIIVLDIKDLSKINELYGRIEGNNAINTIAHLLNTVVENGISCRLGNGEFVCVIPNQEKSADKILSIKKKICTKLKNLKKFQYELDIYTGYDFGCIGNKKHFEKLLNSAIGYKNSKKIRENKIQSTHIFSDEERQEISLVREILDDNLFKYHFQPIVNARTGEIYAYEALMRADIIPSLSPLKILKYAEYLERLYDVERSTFFNILNKLENENLLPEGKKIFINSIPGNLFQGEDAINIEQKIKQYAGTLVVELTEQAEISDEELARIKDVYESIGIETAVDDYGTGYSNVSNLLRYMPNYVKIDRLLLSKIQESPQKQHFVREIIEFAHDNNIKALAEGVETSEELQLVIHLGVDLIQGFYTSKPSPEIIAEINRDIKSEILRYQLQEKTKKGQMVYIASKERTIYTAKLLAEKFTEVEFGTANALHKDFSIVGIAGVYSKLFIKINDGYKGRITLDNVYISAKKDSNCIEIGENCEITLDLVGENQFNDGGIRVPKSSKLIIEGDGNLTFNMIRDNYYAIGNSLKEDHGLILLNQDGCVEIHGGGNRGIGIGSGLGGEIKIQKGKYIIEIIGEEGVGIGAFDSDVNIDVRHCNINLNMSSTSSVGIGSLHGNVFADFEHILLRGFFGGIETTGIGSLDGKSSDIQLTNTNINFNLRANKACGIGFATENSNINIRDTGLVIKSHGENAISFGNFKKAGSLKFNKCDIISRVKSEKEYDIGFSEENIEISDSRCYFDLNGIDVPRK